MLKAVVRIGDSGSHGGAMSSSSSTVIAGGQRLCVDQDILNCAVHGPQAVSSSSTVKANGRGILRIGDTAACGATITSGDTLTTSS